MLTMKQLLYLTPFFVSVYIYFRLNPDKISLSYEHYALVKALPVCSLLFFLLTSPSRHRLYTQQIMQGLFLSLIGDVILVWDYEEWAFALGLIMFAAAHIAYSFAFGFQSAHYPTGIVVLLISLSIYVYLIPGLQGNMLYLTLIYVILISVMLWRSLTRVGHLSNLLSGRFSSTPALCGAIGAALFVLSDTFIAINRFHHTLQNSHVLIHSSYFSAQLGIALSAL